MRYTGFLTTPYSLLPTPYSLKPRTLYLTELINTRNTINTYIKEFVKV
ncbi:MAG: hypothetical protein F6J90_29020 [Moorea sp. SIOASIH]|nr:hypothetical protein [Moorena sp. SIOASIH]NEO40167.1 hypothetical protein [Moorena sp. SIOASIH]